MRSQATAEELISQGKDVNFIGQISGLPWVEERIITLGFTQIYRVPNGFTSNPETDVLILDSCEIEEDTSSLTQQNRYQISVIVDEMTPNHRCTLRVHPHLDLNWTGNS